MSDYTPPTTPAASAPDATGCLHEPPFLPLRLVLFACLFVLPMAHVTARELPARTGPAVVIAHRGASALRPEHTLEAYAQAIADGADFIEPDLVPTRDGVLVARHENGIGDTTDVAAHPEFAARRAKRVIDGKSVEDWFTDDFTLAELRTLRARERLPKLRSTAHDGQFAIPTFDEVIDLAATASAARGKFIGLIPEIKHSTYFRGQGLAMEERLLERLDAHAHTQCAPVVVQSFEVGNLRWLRDHLGARANVRLMQLVGRGGAFRADGPADGDGQLTFARMLTPDGLRDIARYADILGPPSQAILPVTADGTFAAATTLVADAHAAGLQVMPYTFRPENHFLPRALWRGGDPRTVNKEGSLAEIRAHLDAGIDGFFTDDSAIGREAVRGR